MAPVPGSQMSGQPDAAMMAPIELVARFIKTGDDSCLKAFADEGVTILENFAPHLFSGPRSVNRWAEAMRAHASTLSGLSHRFAPACDFSIEGDRAFLTLPTHWSGLSNGRRFEEDGGWAFLLVRQGGEWRVLSYGWAVTNFAFDEKPVAAGEFPDAGFRESR